MRLDSWIGNSSLAAAAVLVIGAALVGHAQEEGEDKAFEADSGPAYIDVSGYPEEMQELYALYSRKCSKCHTLARSVNSSYRGDDWKLYIKRMSRKPDSGISPRTGEKILRFLTYHFEQVDAGE